MTFAEKLAHFKGTRTLEMKIITSICRMMIIRLVLESMSFSGSLEFFPDHFGKFFAILGLFEKNLHFCSGTVYKASNVKAVLLYKKSTKIAFSCN